MTVASTTNRVDYVGNGNVDTYSYTFKIFNPTELKVTVRDLDDIETVLTHETHYTVTGAGAEAGGTVVLVNGAFDWIDAGGDLETGFALTIRRVRPLTQEADIRNQGAYYQETHEDVFDKLVMADQQQQDEIDRSVKLPETVSAASFSATLPSDIVGSANRAFIINATGNGFDIGPTSAEIAGANASAVAAAASAAAALNSENAAETSETNAATSAADAATTAASITGFVQDAEDAAAAAAASETASAASATAAAASETAAATSATNSANSATASATSATNSANSATAAATSATNSANSATASATSATAAAASETAAADSAADAAASAASITTPTVATHTANHTAVANTFNLGNASGGAFTYTVPTAVGVSGQKITFQKTDTSWNQITINSTSSQTLGPYSSGSLKLATQNESISFISDGTNWQIDSWTVPAELPTTTFTFTGLGTVNNLRAHSARVGKFLDTDLFWGNGTVTGSTVEIIPPSGLTIQTSNMFNGAANWVGSLLRNTNPSGYPHATYGPFVLFVDPSVSATKIWVAASANANGFVAQTGSGLFGSGDFVHARLRVPIVGWGG